MVFWSYKFFYQAVCIVFWVIIEYNQRWRSGKLFQFRGQKDDSDMHSYLNMDVNTIELMGWFIFLHCFCVPQKSSFICLINSWSCARVVWTFRMSQNKKRRRETRCWPPKKEYYVSTFRLPHRSWNVNVSHHWSLHHWSISPWCKKVDDFARNQCIAAIFCIVKASCIIVHYFCLVLGVCCEHSLSCAGGIAACTAALSMQLGAFYTLSWAFYCGNRHTVYYVSILHNFKKVIYYVCLYLLRKLGLISVQACYAFRCALSCLMIVTVSGLRSATKYYI